MQFICFLEPVRPEMPDEPTPDERDAVGAHFAYYTGLLERGTLLLAGRTQNAPFTGIFIFEAESETDALAIVEADPAIQRGVMTHRVQPYQIALQR